MSAPVTLRSFSGETDDDVQPGEFLKTFRRFTTSACITDDDLIITSFGDHLKYGSPADDWFAELTSTKQTWKEVETAFLQRFPPVEKAKRTETELERELCELRLKTEDLGKKEKYAGEEVYTHVIFAEKALSLAKQAKISTGSNSIWKVRDELPDIIRQKVKETYPTWTEFCAAIKRVEMAHIRDGVKKYQKEKEEKEKTEAAIASLQRLHLQGQRRLPAAPTSSVSNVSQTQQSSTLGGQRNNTPQSNSTNTNAYMGPSSGQGNLPRPAPSPITEADRSALIRSLALYPMQPNTEAGIAAWHAQLREWKAKNGETAEVTVNTGFPLQPGGEAPGSGECYRCGRGGHRRIDMRCTTDQINNKERTFRTICGRILRAAPTSRVNFVSDADDEFSWLNHQAFRPTPSPGNGEGPPA
ncbi:uncharacterized protein LACBIDRAFT_296317 [Laccaria bicolor S238N-H82]|uniref:Predicted protein n=1 Tax=Laccaria bicolor (strain S238N-H82 / ATCC MYA-4686) TaxID=486041 RepID=B0D8I1_LACBS|nr:uncharacterized protein LACBIDRAFT_296317 [Laccaria bicolor S238N-H82]EDR08841.1 predicted protein [Laccaria bicolor S238N-H82]|eukprot:XP_001880154.1 predicted protein [Laccaria bicolor S238N-H82]